MREIAQTFDPAIRVDAIAEHFENPRRGDDATVADSVEAHGFFGGILVQRSTGRVLAGNTRLRVARAAGATTVPGFWLDVDDEQARRILLVDNRASDVALYDDVALFGLLDDLRASAAGLAATGYDETAYDLLAATIAALAVGDGALPPAAFGTIDPDGLTIEHRCPSCGYEWSGSPAPGRPTHRPNGD